MDRAMQLAHLAQAERHIASGLCHIENQEQIIAGLDRGDHYTAVALELCQRRFKSPQMCRSKIPQPQGVISR